MQMIKSVSIENMINQTEGAFEKIEQARMLLDEANELLKSANAGDVMGAIYDRSGGWSALRLMNDDWSKSIKREIAREAWKHLMNESGMMSLMDAKRKEDWNELMFDRTGKKSIPELNYDNIISTFKNLHEQRDSIFEDGIEGCFKSLSWDYKTNNPYRFGKKIIVSGFCELSYFGGFQANSYRTGDKIRDLERVFHLMDGKPAPDHRTDVVTKMFDTELQAKGVPSARQSGEFEDTYFKFKLFQNGNAHIWLKREDLVEKLNVTIAKRFPGALPAKGK